MDWKEASRTLADCANSARRWSATALDSLAPWCAPLAVRWDAEADRRRQLRTDENLRALLAAQREYNSARSLAAQASHQRKQARAASKNPFASVRRAARTADRAASQQRDSARSALRDAKRNYPPTLARTATVAHAAHTVPTVGLSALLTATGHDLTVWPASLSALAVGLNAGAVWLGRRKVVAVVADDSMSVEERQLMERLDPAYWVEHASDRGLGGTVTGVPQVGGAGITCAVRLDGQWTVEKLSAAEGHIRALLGCRTGLRLRVTAGDRGGWATLTLGTRTAVDGASLLWTPERAGIGLDTGTGEVVTLPHGRKVIAGTSGAGKSVLLRTILAPYALDPLSAVLYIDAKGEESGLWRHCAREAIDPEDISDLVAEVVDEMLSRRDLMRERQVATWEATEARPRLVVLVDEGADLIAMDSKKTPIIPGLEQITRQGRSRLVDLLWCTQKPTVGEGIPSQIIGNMSVRIGLQMAGESETRQIMGKGWQNHFLPGPGLAYVRGTGRDAEQTPVAVWDASDDRLVTGLPARQVWGAQESAPMPAPAGRPALRLVKDGDYELAPPAPPAEEAAVPAPRVETAAAPVVPDDLTDNQRAVYGAVRDGASTNAEIARATGLNPGSVDRAVRALGKRGLVAKEGTTIRLEVSA